MGGVVAIVGRPNVGKSTLFNRLAGGRVAIVEDEPGVTRDRIYRQVEWCGRRFTLVDTGGLDALSPAGEISGLVRRQVEAAIAEASLVLFLVDARSGVTAADREAADLLRRSGRPYLLVANKVEDFRDPTSRMEFYELGLGEPFPVSAAHGLNTGDLLDQVVQRLPDDAPSLYPEEAIRVAVLGRPNVGKSSLVNRLLGEERVIVSDIPGTTRDAVDTLVSFAGQPFLLIDTAGIRRKARIKEATEHYSVLRAMAALERAQVALIMLDAQEGVTEQDQRVAGMAHESGKASVLVLNKWDLVEKDTHTMQHMDEDIRDQLPFMPYAPSLYISARTGQRVERVLEAAREAFAQAGQRITTGTLNDLLEEAQQLNPPPSDKGRRLKILYASQVGVRPPCFALFVNDPELLHFSYQRYLENRLREAYGFRGTPIRWVIRRRGKREK